MTWEGIAGGLEKSTYICGEIGPEARKALADQQLAHLAPPALCLRRPGFLAELAWQKLRSGKLAEASSLVPIYLQSQDGAKP